MASVSNATYKPEVNRGELVTDLTNLLNRNNGEMQMAGATAGQAVSDAEQNLIEAYSLDPANTADAQALSKELGIKDKKGEFVRSAEALQLVLKARLDRALRAFTSLQEIFSTSHQAMMRLIHSLRAG